MDKPEVILRAEVPAWAPRMAAELPMEAVAARTVAAAEPIINPDINPGWELNWWKEIPVGSRLLLRSRIGE